MLIKVDVYEGTSTSSSRPTLYSCVGTTIRRYYGGGDNNNGDDNNPNAGLLLSVGRKGSQNDILFPSDKSVSRVHAQIRCVGIRPVNNKHSGPGGSKSKSKSSPSKSPRPSPRKKEEQQDEDDPPRALHGCMAPRNDAELAACRSSPTNMCLVLEYTGKTGLFVAQPKKPIVDDIDDSQKKKKEKKGEGDDDGGSDSDTDVEDNNNNSAPIINKLSRNVDGNSSISSSNAASTITAATTVTAGPTTIPTLATQDFVSKNYNYYQNNPQQIDMIPVMETMILPLGRYTGDRKDDNDQPLKDGKINTTSSLFIDEVSNRAVMIQLSKGSPITLKIEWIPIRVVFSSVDEKIKMSLVKDLYKIGTIVQPQVVSATNSHLQGVISPTTHLVASQFYPVPKQITAWALGLPFVSPDWLSDMISMTSTTTAKCDDNVNADVADLTTVLPFVYNDSNGNKKYSPKPNRGSNFWLKKTDETKLLLSHCTLLIQNEDDDAERLGGAAGMNIIRLYQLGTQKLKKQRIAELVSAMNSDGSDDNDKCLVIATTSPLSSNSVDAATAKSITVISMREIAKALTSQSSKFMDTIKHRLDEKGCSMNHNTANASTDADEENANENTDDDMDAEPESGFSQAPLLFERDFVKRNDERKGDVDSAKEYILSTLQEEDDDDDNKNDEGNNYNAKEQSCRETLIKTTRTNILSGDVKRPLAGLGRANVTGWYTTAPKDDATRFLMRQQASKAYADQNEGRGFDDPISSADIIRVMDVPNSTSTTSSRPGDGTRLGWSNRGSSGSSNNNRSTVTTTSGIPDFRKFRKNYIVIPDIGDCVILKDDEAPNTTRSEASDQMTEQHLLLVEQQRRADALFLGTAGGLARGTGTGGATKRRRRT